MKHSLQYGRISWSYNDFDPEVACRPTPLFQFKTIRIAGRAVTPKLSDKHALLLLKRKLPKVMSFSEAYRSWWKSGRREIEELGEGLSFLKWLKANGLSVAFKRSDFHFHPYFQPSGTKDSEHLFTITSVDVLGRKVKLFVEDEDMIQILHFPYGRDVDFLVSCYGHPEIRDLNLFYFL